MIYKYAEIKKGFRFPVVVTPQEAAAALTNRHGGRNPDSIFIF